MVASGFMSSGHLSFINQFSKKWPQQPLTEKVLISVKHWIFDDTFYKKGTIIGHFGARDEPTIRISIFLNEMRL